MLTVTFHGVRGSSACHGPSTVRYGGNTSCVSVEADGSRPLLLDLGSGLRYFGHSYAADDSPALDAVALVSHLHWDHIQGLPFFSPMLRRGARMSIYGPRQDDGSRFSDALHRAVSPPVFPVSIGDFPVCVDIHDVERDDLDIDGYTILARPVPHIGATVGYRIEHGGVVIAYIPDHQQPPEWSPSPDHPPVVNDDIRRIIDGADLLIHDSQYTRHELSVKAHWGHCTPEYAVAIARACGAKRLALFHHDPERTDDELDARSACSPPGLEVFVAREGMSISL